MAARHQSDHHRRTHSLREGVNTLFQLRAGYAWDLLPHELLPKGAVYDYFHLGNRNGVFARLHAVLREQVRERAGREALPIFPIAPSI